MRCNARPASELPTVKRMTVFVITFEHRLLSAKIQSSAQIPVKTKKIRTDENGAGGECFSVSVFVYFESISHIYEISAIADGYARTEIVVLRNCRYREIANIVAIITVLFIF